MPGFIRLRLLAPRSWVEETGIRAGEFNNYDLKAGWYVRVILYKSTREPLKALVAPAGQTVNLSVSFNGISTQETHAMISEHCHWHAAVGTFQLCGHFLYGGFCPIPKGVQYQEFNFVVSWIRLFILQLRPYPPHREVLTRLNGCKLFTLTPSRVLINRLYSR